MKPSANNLFSINGNLTKAPILRHTDNGKDYCYLTVAVNTNSSKDAKADFLTVTVWGKQAELAAQYLVKGQHVSIIGSINSFIDKDKKLQFRLNSYDVQFGSKPQLSKNKDQPIENNKGEKEIECSEPEQEPIEPPEEYFSEEPEEEPEV